MPAKTYEETLLIKQRYADLTEPAFKVLRECLEGDNILDKKWACEQLGKAFVKMIPQTIAGDPENPLEHNFKLDDSAKQTIRDAVRGVANKTEQE